MENKKKIWAAVAAIVIIVVLALVFVLGGKDNTTVADTDVVETITTETVTVEDTNANGESTIVDNIDYLAGIGEAPEDNSTDEVVENETIKDFVDETDNKVEDTKDETSTGEASEDVSVIEPGVVDEPTSETKPSVDPNVGGNTGNGGNNGNNGGNETPSSETSTPPVVNPEPTNPPASSGNGDNLSFSGSVTLPSGLTINTLDEFNNAGMNLDDSWLGDVNSNIVAQNFETLATNFDNFNAMYGGSSINFTNSEQIWWRASKSDMSAALEIRKCGDHYKVIIRGPYLDLATAQSMGWAGLDSYRVAMSQEALVVLLSTISSRPQELQNAIIQTIYTAPAGQEPIDTNGNWTSIGDCRIRLGAYDFENGNHEVVFRIAP